MHTNHHHWYAFLTVPELWLGRLAADRLRILEAARTRILTPAPRAHNTWGSPRPPTVLVETERRRPVPSELVVALVERLGVVDPFAGPPLPAAWLSPYLLAHHEYADLGFVDPSYAVRDEWHLPTVLELVGNHTWIESFLGGKAPAWERGLITRGEAGQVLSVPSVMECAQALLRRIQDSRTPLSLSELVWGMEGTRKETLARALAALLRYLLVFAGLDPGSHEPRFGLWPALTAWLHRPPPVLPPVMDPVETFHRPLMIEDLEVLLGEVVVRPPRLRSTQMALHARAAAGIQAALPVPPAWATPWVTELSLRLMESVALAQAQRLVRKATDRESGMRQLSPQPGLQDWYSLPAGQRLRRLFDGFKTTRDRWSYPGSGTALELVPDQPTWRVIPTHRQVDVTAAVLQSWGRLAGAGFRPVDGTLDYLARNHNPVAEILEPGESLQTSLYQHHDIPGVGMSPSVLEATGRELLRQFLVRRLVPLAGVRLGLAADGTVLCELTDAGRFLLGLTPELTLAETAGGEVVVQPDFEVVFLAPNPRAEADLGRFCARVGRGQGVLFRLTRDACLAASRNGLSAGDAMALLEKHSSKPVPGNVRHEVQSWFGQVRTVTLRRPLLIECPDAETAARVLGVLRKTARLLTPETLEVTKDGLSTHLRTRLQAAGVFITAEDPPDEPVWPGPEGYRR